MSFSVFSFTSFSPFLLLLGIAISDIFSIINYSTLNIKSCLTLDRINNKFLQSDWIMVRLIWQEIRTHAVIVQLQLYNYYALEYLA